MGVPFSAERESDLLEQLGQDSARAKTLAPIAPDFQRNLIKLE
jgi:hypothetical protein